MKSISDLFRHSTTVASLVAASAVTAGFLAPSASAGNLVPQDVEGEIKTKNLGCIVAEADCLDPETFDHPYTVTSLPFDDLDPSFDLSRLFVDLGGTANNYPLGISFSERDAGTNPEVVEEFWLRPVALQNGAPVEGGELEVGRFRFEFAEAIEVMKLDLSFFDVEDDFVSGILEVNGEEFEDGLLEGGPDDAIQTVMLTDVSSFVVQLGNPDSLNFSTGDGVLLQAEKMGVPEPGTVLGLSALAMAGALGLGKRGKKADV